MEGSGVMERGRTEGNMKQEGKNECGKEGKIKGRKQHMENERKERKKGKVKERNERRKGGKEERKVGKRDGRVD